MPHTTIKISITEYYVNKNIKFLPLHVSIGRKEGNVLFNSELNTFYFTTIWHWTYD